MRRKTKPVKDRTGPLVCVTGKIGFRSEALALEALERHDNDESNRHAKTVRAYGDCPACPWWHLTSKEHRYATN